MKNLFANFKKKFLNKKMIIGSVVVIVAVVITILGISNFKRPDSYQLALDNIAEARFYLKSAEVDNPIGTVHFYSGVREEDFKADGIATPSKAFTILSVEPKDQKVVASGCITAEISINGEAPTEIVLEKNPYGNNYAVDLEKAVDETATIEVTFKSGAETVGVVTLNNVMPENSIKWETALEIACKEMSKKLDSGTRIETSTKILCDNTTVNTPYWFISFILEDGNRYFVVVSNDGKVIGTSENK